LYCESETEININNGYLHKYPFECCVLFEKYLKKKTTSSKYFKHYSIIANKKPYETMKPEKEGKWYDTGKP